MTIFRLSAVCPVVATVLVMMVAVPAMATTLMVALAMVMMTAVVPVRVSQTVRVTIVEIPADRQCLHHLRPRRKRVIFQVFRPAFVGSKPNASKRSKPPVRIFR